MSERYGFAFVHPKRVDAARVLTREKAAPWVFLYLQGSVSAEQWEGTRPVATLDTGAGQIHCHLTTDQAREVIDALTDALGELSPLGDTESLDENVAVLSAGAVQ
jgi:hypothetical protein